MVVLGGKEVVTASVVGALLLVELRIVVAAFVDVTSVVVSGALAEVTEASLIGAVVVIAAATVVVSIAVENVLADEDADALQTRVQTLKKPL